GHGGEPLTSVMNYLYPEDMRMDLIPEQREENAYWEKFKIDNLLKFKLGGSRANIFLNMEEISKEGIMGNPSKASVKRGKKIVSCIVEYGVSLIKKVRESNMVKNNY